MEKLIVVFIFIAALINSANSKNHFTPHFTKNELQFSWNRKDTLTSENLITHDINRLIDCYISDTWNTLITPVKMSPKSWVKMGGVLSVTGFIYAIDSKIMKSWHRSYESRLVRYVSDTGELFEPMGQLEKMNPYCISTFMVGYLLKLPKVQEASIQIVESLSIASGFKQLIRETVGRARPCEHKGTYFLKFGVGESFPSGHTSNAFQVATILAHHVDYLPFTITAYGLASCIGLWRIDTNSHWPSDVFFGAVYGTAVSKLLLAFHKKRRIRIVPRADFQQNKLGLSVNWML